MTGPPPGAGARSLPTAVRAARAGWAVGLARAARFGARPDATAVALVGFLIRGGLVLLVLPIVVLPSPIGIASGVGLDALTIAATPTSWLVEAVAVAAVLLVAWLLAAGVGGALVDAWLVDAWLVDAWLVDPSRLVGDASRVVGDASRLAGEPGGAAGAFAGASIPRSTLLRLAGIRGLFLVPLAVVVTWTGVLVGDSIQYQLLTPTNLAAPLPLRVLEDSAPGVVALVVVWLVTETLGAIAVRRLLLSGGGIWRSAAAACVEAARRPLSTLAAAGAAFGASAVVIGLAIAAEGVVFGWCDAAARATTGTVRLSLGGLSLAGDPRPVLLALAAAALAVVWLATLWLAGVASAWRSALFTSEVAAALPGNAPPPDALEAEPGPRDALTADG